LHDRALRLLAVRSRSSHELRSRLLRAGFEPDEVATEIDRLEDVGLLDDRRFAHEVVEHQVGVRRSGRRAVAAALATKGVDRRTIEETLAEVGDDEGARAEDLARTRALRLVELPREVAYSRLVGFLARRGYDPGTAHAAARRALALDGAGEEMAGEGHEVLPRES
jgi:regulatory protein